MSYLSLNIFKDIIPKRQQLGLSMKKCLLDECNPKK